MNHYCILYCSLVDLFASPPSTNSLSCYIEEQAQALVGMITPTAIPSSPKFDTRVEYLFDIEAEEVSVEGEEVSDEDGEGLSSADARSGSTRTLGRSSDYSSE